MATCTGVIITIILTLFLVIILCIIGTLVYVWVTCPSLTRCTWNLIWGRPFNERPLSDKDFFASIDGTGNRKYTSMSEASVFGEGINIEKDSFGGTKSNIEKEAPSNVGGNADYYDAEKRKILNSNGPGKGSTIAPPSKKERAFDRMGPSFDDW